MKIFHYDKYTFEHLSTSNAYRDPLDKGKFIIPAQSSVVEPGDCEKGFVKVFNKESNKWDSREDKRGVKYFNKKGDEFTVRHLLEKIPKDCTLTAPLKTKEELFEQKKREIDERLTADMNGIFQYNGNNFLPDERSITRRFVSLDYFDENFISIWKTIDKEQDGVTSVYAEMNKSEFVKFAMAFFKRQDNAWSLGDEKKKKLKIILKDTGKTAKDLKDFKA